ncbi:hypothetical protein KAW65_04390 [candidate division WOR-3 bacterium]|nr:hypothetical protein [candidate division WOR-3 bacterium]
MRNKLSISNYQLAIIIFLMGVFIGVQGFAYYQTPEVQTQRGISKPFKPQDKAADFWWVHWTGIGNLTDWTVSNTLQGGYFPCPQGCRYFDGTWNCVWLSLDMLSANMHGLCGEYPAGTNQFYNWASGVWVGAKYPDKIEGPDTTWQPRVSKGAYYSDLGAMNLPELTSAGEAGDISGTGLSFSNQILPIGYGYSHEGQFVFKQYGAEQEDYQALWPFADMDINVRREDSTTHVDTTNGDIISMEDSYACAGDWIPKNDASCIWIRDTGPYDVWGLGIRIEQRTYSWNYEYNNAYIYFNWKIKNMNSFPLKDIYVGYFMDNDIGSGVSAEGQAAEDDLIDYDRSLNLGYSYDADSYEPGWETPAGFIGCIMCKTPGNLGMTGFQTWTRTGEFGMLIDDDGQDSLKYVALSTARANIDTFQRTTVPNDVRQLSCSGPYVTLLPDSEISFTIAVVVAYTLAELKTRAGYALEQFKSGYLGFAPPPSPQLSIVPSDRKVYLSWDNKPEKYVCKMTHDSSTFAGYRVYRSSSGLPGKWDLLADYDIQSDSTKDTVLVDHPKGISKANISFVRFLKDSVLNEDKYSIRFLSSKEFILQNDSADGEIYEYNRNAIADGGGYCIMVNPDSAYPTNTGYLSGREIYFDGIFISITDAVYDNENPGIQRFPTAGDVFTVQNFKGKSIGGQKGIKHYYIDEGLTNGITYYYSVTSYSCERPLLGITGLESGLSGKTYWAIPRKDPVNFELPSCKVTRISGEGDSKVEVIIVDPSALTGDEYKISFLPVSPGKEEVGYWRLTDETKDTIVLDSVTAFHGEQNIPVTDGFSVIMNTYTETVLDTEKVIDATYSKWEKGESNYEFFITTQKDTNIKRHEFDVKVVEIPGSFETWTPDSFECMSPITVINKKWGAARFFFDDNNPGEHPNKADSIFNKGDKIYFYAPGDTVKNKYMYALEVMVDTANIIAPEKDDIYYVKLLYPSKVVDSYKIETVSATTEKTDYKLDNVRVVPNPYYVKAGWEGEMERKIYFANLPSKCTIRIFNVAGLLIKTIEHDETSGPVFKTSAQNETGFSGTHAWDLLTKEGLETVSGLYIYQVVTSDGKDKVGKFAIIR